MSDTPNDTPARTARRGTFWLLLFWLALLAALYGGFDYYGQQRQARYKAYTSSTGALVIPRSPDGHFYVAGEINGQPLRFMVDTGASSISVTESFAQQAGLSGGAPATFATANGTRQGRMLRDVPVLVGGLSALSRVGIGLTASRPDEALLGQSFLSQFNVRIQGQTMTITPQ